MSTTVGGGVPDPRVWRRRDDVVWRRSLDAAIVLSAGAEDPVTLPGTGAAVWDLLAEPATLAELVGTLVEVYGGDSATIERDVAGLLEHLRALHVVEAE